MSLPASIRAAIRETVFDSSLPVPLVAAAVAALVFGSAGCFVVVLFSDTRFGMLVLAFDDFERPVAGAAFLSLLFGAAGGAGASALTRSVFVVLPLRRRVRADSPIFLAISSPRLLCCSRLAGNVQFGKRDVSQRIG